MQHKGILIAAGAALVLALVSANIFSHRGSPEPGAMAPEDITAPHGDPPPPVTASEAPPGRTLSDGAARGREGR